MTENKDKVAVCPDPFCEGGCGYAPHLPKDQMDGDWPEDPALANVCVSCQ